MNYVNILYDAIESALNLELNIGQITSYGKYHYIDFQGPEDFEYKMTEAQLVQSTIDNIVRSLDCNDLVFTEIVPLPNSTRYYKVRTTVVYSFDPKYVEVCKGCKDFFLPNNPAQQYDEIDHYFNCPVCNKHYKIPNFLTRKVLRGIIGESIPFNLDNIQVIIDDQQFQGRNIVPNVIVKNGDNVLREDIDYYIAYCSDNYDVTKEPEEYVCGYILPNSNKNCYVILDLNHMDSQVLCYARNEIYARHGYTFPSEELATYFNRQPWYRNLPEYNDNKREIEEEFSYEEKCNVNLINTLELRQENPYILDLDGYDYTPVYDYIHDYGLEFEVSKLPSIALVGKWKYQGSILTYFRIVPNSLSKCIYSSIQDQVYDGNPKNPSISISIGDYVLKPREDYKLSYENNVDVGVGKVIIESLGTKFTGQVEKHFNIINIDSEHYIFIRDIEDQSYTGSYIVPELLIMLDGLVLIEGKDYTVNWSNNKNRGVANGTIVGTGRKLDWVGTKVVKFNIV